MDRSRRLWAGFLSLATVFFITAGMPNLPVAQVSLDEEPFPAGAIVIDDSDARRFAIEGDGWMQNEFPIGYRGSVWMKKSMPQADTSDAAAHWRFGPQDAGAYDVYATWVWGKALPTAIAYTVSVSPPDDSGPTLALSAAVDQQKSPAGPRWEGSMYPWQKLGTILLSESDTEVTVSLRGDATETFSADAVLLLPQGRDDAQTDDLSPSTDAPSAPPETIGYLCDRGFCRAVIGGPMTLLQCQESCDRSAAELPGTPAVPVRSDPTPTALYGCQNGSCQPDPDGQLTLQQCQLQCGAPPATKAEWVRIGPPHTPYTSCALECAARGGACIANGCSPFRTIWDGKTWTGGQKLTANDVLLFHNACDAQWGNLAESLQNECCCTESGPAPAAPFCGDGIVQRDLGEECDDGNRKPGDGCSPTCKLEYCGDGIVSPALGEECDPALPQTIPGVSCSARCTWEYCGDGIVQTELGEECDDGDNQNSARCTTDCRFR